MITDERIEEDLQALGVDFWLFDYARMICRPLRIGKRILKGRNHEPRREISTSDPFERLLPHQRLHPPRAGADLTGHRKLKDRSVTFGTVKIALEDHYEILRLGLLACGYDLETSRVVSLEAYGAARLYWQMNHEVMPKQMADRLVALSGGEIRREEADLFNRIQS